MTTDARAQLGGELGGRSAAINALTPQDSRLVLDLFRRARDIEVKAVDKSITDTLAALPRIFRGPARKIMFGSF